MVHSLHKKNQEVEFLRNESDLAILTNEELIYFISSSMGNPIFFNPFINGPVFLKQESLIFLLYSENNIICLNNREFLENSRILYKSPFFILPGVYWRTSRLIGLRWSSNGAWWWSQHLSLMVRTVSVCCGKAFFSNA